MVGIQRYVFVVKLAGSQVPGRACNVVPRLRLFTTPLNYISSPVQTYEFRRIPMKSQKTLPVLTELVLSGLRVQLYVNNQTAVVDGRNVFILECEGVRTYQ